MNVFIARGSVDVGRFPREQLPELARKGVIRRTDTYWHKGMDGWEPISDLLGPSVWEPGSETPVLKPIPEQAQRSSGASSAGATRSLATESSETPPPRRSARGAVAVFAVLVLLGLAALGYFLIKPDTEPMEPTGTMPMLGGGVSGNSWSLPIAMREKAMADLQQRIARLPQQPSPPLNTYYYDMAIDVQETFERRAALRAMIRGRENVLKPESEETLSRTEFAVTAEYADGEWSYMDYLATTLNTEDQTTSTIKHDATRIAPPVLVGILGLKTADYSPAPR